MKYTKYRVQKQRSKVHDKIFEYIAKPLKNRYVLSVYFSPRFVVVLIGRQPNCVLRLAMQKIHSIILYRFSSGSAIHDKIFEYRVINQKPSVTKTDGFCCRTIFLRRHSIIYEKNIAFTASESWLLNPVP